MTPSSGRNQLTARFNDALTFAAEVHAGDVRKGAPVPYIAHLLSVCSLVLSDGGDEDEAIAALLHDTLEDHPELVTRDDLRQRFGARVLSLVEACTDTPPDYTGGTKPPWRQRKLAYLDHLASAPAEDLRVVLADKVDNAHTILTDYQRHGEELWSRFNAGRDEQLWLYRSVTDALRARRPPGRLLEQLECYVGELEKEVGGGNKAIVEEYLEGFRTTDHARVLACLTDDVEWEIPGMFHVRGKEAFDREIENDAFEGSPRITVDRMVEENDVVIAEGTVEARKKGGELLNLRFCDVFSMQARKIRRLVSYIMEAKP
jgi:ketosteroid isomerase-like protein